MKYLSLPTPILSATLEKDDVGLAKNWLTKSKDSWHEDRLVREWERTFTDWLGVKAAFAFMGGRAALYAAVRALDLQPEDQVIVPAFTCQAVINSFRYQGVEPCYADIELDTYGLDIDSVKKMFNPSCKAIMIQYTFGLVSRDLLSLIEFAREHNLYIIEDCAHALGATFQNKKLGSFGDVAIFSSERSKIINTIHGGMVTCNNPVLIERMQNYYDHAPISSDNKIKQLLNTVIQNYYLYVHPFSKLTTHWANWRYQSNQVLPQMFPEELLGNYCTHYEEKMSAPIAALSLNQFNKMAKFHTQRMESAKKWDAWCTENNYKKPVVIPNSVPTFLRYPVLVPEHMKQDLSWTQKELNVTAGVWFSSASHPSPSEPENCPNGAKAAKECINLPTLLLNQS